jgi:hypothetical protein
MGQQARMLASCPHPPQCWASNLAHTAHVTTLRAPGLGVPLSQKTTQRAGHTHPPSHPNRTEHRHSMALQAVARTCVDSCCWTYLELCAPRNSASANHSTTWHCTASRTTTCMHPACSTHQLMAQSCSACNHMSPASTHHSSMATAGAPRYACRVASNNAITSPKRAVGNPRGTQRTGCIGTFQHALQDSHVGAEPAALICAGPS